MRPIGHVGIDFDAAVHRAGVQDENVARRVARAARAKRRTRDCIRAATGCSPPCMRSSCRRRTLSASAHSMASSTRLKTVHAHLFDARWAAATADRTRPLPRPSCISPQMFDARDARVQHVAARCTPAGPRAPKWSRSVRRSSSPCVGCSCVPSPALITLDSMRSARNRAAPDAPCRITTMSIRIASRFRAVSTSVSPLAHAGARDRHVHRIGATAAFQRTRTRCACAWTPRRTG